MTRENLALLGGMLIGVGFGFAAGADNQLNAKWPEWIQALGTVAAVIVASLGARYAWRGVQQQMRMETVFRESERLTKALPGIRNFAFTARDIWATFAHPLMGVTLEEQLEAIGIDPKNLQDTVNQRCAPYEGNDRKVLAEFTKSALQRAQLLELRISKNAAPVVIERTQELLDLSVARLDAMRKSFTDFVTKLDQQSRDMRREIDAFLEQGKAYGLWF